MLIYLIILVAFHTRSILTQNLDLNTKDLDIIKFYENKDAYNVADNNLT